MPASWAWNWRSLMELMVAQYSFLVSYGQRSCRPALCFGYTSNILSVFNPLLVRVKSQLIINDTLFYSVFLFLKFSQFTKLQLKAYLRKMSVKINSTNLCRYEWFNIGLYIKFLHPPPPNWHHMFVFNYMIFFYLRLWHVPFLR